jgi:transcription antitermination factor NusG
LLEKHWFALQVRYRQELRVEAQLSDRGIDAYTPFLSNPRLWSDRTKNVRVPLFAGYTFCRLDPSARLLPILSMPGVVHFVGGNAPAAIPDEEIDAIKKAVASGGMLWHYPGVAVGELVEVTLGPLAGCRGRIQSVDDRAWSLVISISLLQRSLAVAVDPAWVTVVRPERFGPQPYLEGSKLTPMGRARAQTQSR